MYLGIFESTPTIGEIHLGGGTPTFFDPENLQILLEGIITSAVVKKDAVMSFEGHPANTTYLHLKTLYDLGFRRVSYGIQDFSEHVQKIINRKQTFEDVLEVTNIARNIGYESINYDLVYGLPGQTMETLKNTLLCVNKLKPNRIAFYSYAHVPWLRPAQKSFSPDIIPDAQAKAELYLTGKQMLAEYGYLEVGMDHYALPSDSLIKSMKNETLHRNFMGYTTGNAKLMVGIGVSSISDAWSAFGQNVKTLEEYYKRINEGQLPIFKGHIHSQDDIVIRRHILNIICHFKTSWHKTYHQSDAIYAALDRWKEMEKDGLITLSPYELKVTEVGRHFLRNICAALDPYFNMESSKSSSKYSSTI